MIAINLRTQFAGSSAQDKPSLQNVFQESMARTSTDTFLSLYIQMTNASVVSTFRYLSPLRIVDQDF